MSGNTGDAYGRAIRQLLSLYPVPTESLLRKYRSLLIANYRPATINQRIYAVNHFLLFLEEEQPELSPDLSGFRPVGSAFPACQEQAAAKGCPFAAALSNR